MTSRQMSIAMNTEIADRTAARSRDLGYMATKVSDDARVRTMDMIADPWNRTADGLIRLRAGMVGRERMTAMVRSLAGELVVTFSSDVRKHSRRFLIDSLGTYVMEDAGRSVVITPANKYWSAINALWTARAN